MRLYRSAGLLIGSLLCSVLLAQSEDDALRISSLMPGGTARSNGLANAFGALGADASCITINPAGFGLYRTSEISLTPSFEVNDAQSTYYGTPAADTQNRFYIGNIALILNTPSKSGNWRSGTFGVVYDRQQSLHWHQTAEGERVPSTILQRFVDEASGTPPASLFDAYPFTSGLAYDAYAIDPLDTVLNTYSSQIPFGSDTRQTNTIDSHGASTNTAFFYSGNYMDRLYVGMSIGIAGHRYDRTTTHSETNLDPDPEAIESVTYKEHLTTTGNGVDVKVGVIGRITEQFRMGASFHSPQWFQLSDAYSTNLSTMFRIPDANGQSSYNAASPDGSFTYRLTTPWRAVLSAAYIAGQNGLFSVDYEYADYRQMHFRSNNDPLNDYDFHVENDLIRDSYRAVHTLRVGTEWRTGNWYYRLGWGIVPDAYVKDDPRHGLALKTYAGGIGYRTDHIGVELGLNYAQRATNYFQYSPYLVEPTHADLRTYRAMLTLSFRP